jgi:hypothetical protein
MLSLLRVIAQQVNPEKHEYLKWEYTGNSGNVRTVGLCDSSLCFIFQRNKMMKTPRYMLVKWLNLLGFFNALMLLAFIGLLIGLL